MPWAPSEMTRTTSELSRPIRIASGSVMCQISSASGFSVVRGWAILGSGGGQVAGEVGLLDLLVLGGDRPHVVVGDRLGLVDIGQPLAAGGAAQGHRRRQGVPVRELGQSHGQSILDIERHEPRGARSSGPIAPPRAARSGPPSTGCRPGDSDRPGPRRFLEPHDDHASPSLGPLPRRVRDRRTETAPGESFRPGSASRPIDLVMMYRQSKKCSLEGTLRILRITPAAGLGQSQRPMAHGGPREGRGPLQRDARRLGLPDRQRLSRSSPSG